MLPVVVVALLAIGQVVVVARGAVIAVDGVREATRVAAIGGTTAEIRAAAVAAGMESDRITISVGRTTTTVTVELRYRQPTSVAIVGRLVGDVTHVERLTMWREDALTN